MDDVKRNGRRRILEIRKYQNRRYYDTTNSVHLSLEQIHRKVCEGNDIRVVDAKSGEDITAKVLTQILLEYEPMKLDFFSTDLLLQVIRVNDGLLKDFYDNYFNDALALFTKSREQFDSFVKQSPFVTGLGSGFPVGPFAGAVDAFAPFSSMFGGKREDRSSRDVAKELEALRRKIEDLQEEIKRK